MSLTKESTVTFTNGNHTQIPLLGFGTYLSSTAEAASSAACALAYGYRHIDTAEFYNNHEGIAEAIASSGIPRESIFITDKINPGGIFGSPERTFEETIALCKANLKRLGTTYVDLYLLHHAFAQERRIEQYRALLELQKNGFVREIGVSNWNIDHLEQIKEAGLPLPAANQIEIHPLCTQHKLIAYLKENGIVPIAYSTLAPLGTWRVAPGQHSSKKDADAVPTLLESLSAKYGKSEAQILLRWTIQQGIPILPKSVKNERIAANADLYDFNISDEDMHALSNLDENRPFAWPQGNPLTLFAK